MHISWNWHKCKCVYKHAYIYTQYVSYICWWRPPSVSETPVSNEHILRYSFLNIILQEKEPGLLEKRFDSRAVVRKNKRWTWTLYGSSKDGSTQKRIGLCQKDTEPTKRRSQGPKLEIQGTNQIMIYSWRLNTVVGNATILFSIPGWLNLQMRNPWIGRA